MKKIILGLVLSMSITMPGFAAEYRGADLPATIHTLAKNAGLYAIINEEVKGKVYMTVPDAPLSEIMDKLSESYDFNWKIEDGYLNVSPAAINSQSKVFTIKYANLAKLKSDLNSYLPDAKVTIYPEYSTVSIDGTPWQIKKAEKKIIESDLPIQQVQIQAYMVEVNKSDSEQLGFNHTWGGYSSTNRNISYATTFNATDVLSKGRILARPIITTHNGLKAELLIGEKIPTITTTISGESKTSSIKYEEVGVKLQALPRVSGVENKFITLELIPEVSSITKWVEYDGGKAPQISTRQAKTTVTVQSGEAVIIGGLIKEEDINNLSGIPFLKDLPILGSLFRNHDRTKSKTEVFIFVTPTILENKLERLPSNLIPEKKAVIEETLPTPTAIEKPIEKPVELAIEATI